LNGIEWWRGKLFWVPGESGELSYQKGFRDDHDRERKQHVESNQHFVKVRPVPQGHRPAQHDTQANYTYQGYCGEKSVYRRALRIAALN
jgi:hypothetical protein